MFWIRADSRQSLDEDFAKIAVSAGLLPEHEYDTIICKNLVLGWLSTTSASWLLIFDNADDPSELLDYWPMSTNGAIIVTSRDPNASSIFFDSFAIELQPLSQKDGAALLCQLTGKDPTPDEAQECEALVEHLGGLPLAISHVGGYLNATQISFEEYAREFETLFHNTSSFDRSERSAMLFGAKFSSIIGVALTELHPDSLKLLRILSFWNPDIISEALFHHLQATVFGSTLRYFKARGSLLRHSLIQRQRDLNQISVHRLVQDAVIMQMQDDELTSMFGLAIDFLDSTWPIGLDSFDCRSSFEPSHHNDLIAHVLRMKTRYEELGLQLAVCTRQSLARMLQRAGWYATAESGILCNC